MRRALFFVLALAACDYDWTIADEDATWPVGQDAGAADATWPVGQDASADDVGDASVDCAALVTRVEAERTAARRCALASGQCGASVTDACGCPVFVADPTSAASITFAASAAELARAGCADSCGACPTQPTTGTCLQQGSAGTLCWP
ncbi:hypothetical protein L6R52_30565 [Myxococcota bacterium]|nr:hypothetical protein [Myxococcota bacterium]